MNSTQSATTTELRERYERYPYPQRNPADERSRLFATGLDDLGVVNFYCFNGRRNIRDNFRVLVAGGGTGDAAIYLAHQLRETNASIVCIDLSQSALEMAQARARQRELEGRIEWRQGDLFDLPDMDFEPFDYINCVGVLHHVADPAAGLQVLRAVLSDDGAIGLKVYARYGRAGIELLQQLIGMVNGDGGDDDVIDSVRGIVDALPPTNPFKRLGGVATQNDAEVFHSLVGTNDHSFTVPQLYTLIESAGLLLAEFTTRQRVLYVPPIENADAPTRAAVEKLSVPQQQAVAELMHGTIKHHACWLTTRENSRMDLDDPDGVPFFSHFARLHGIRDSIATLDAEEWSMKIDLGGNYQAVLKLPLVPAVRSFVKLIDDNRTLGEIVETIRDEYEVRPKPEEVERVCRHVIETLAQYDLLLLRHRSVPSFCFE